MNDHSQARGQDKFVVRLPEGMRDQIEVAARKAGRSMNAEFVQRLAESFEERTAPEVASLQSDIRILKAALQAAHQAMENQNRLINVLTVQPPDAELTPEYIEMHRRLVAEGAWEKIWAEMRELSKSLKEALDLVE
ncbi:Arc family DNA-binding protein [Pseudoxanthomonas mexicana]